MRIIVYIIRLSLCLGSFAFSLSFPLSASAQIESWNTEREIGVQYANHPSVFISESNSLFVVGAAVETSLARQDIWRSALDHDGKLISWDKSSSKLALPLIWHSLVRRNDTIYVIGGFNEVNSPDQYYSTDLVQTATIESGGSIGLWSTTNPSLPDRLAKGGATLVDDRIYFTGGGFWTGNNLSRVSQEVYMTQLDSDDHIEDWNDVGDLPSPRLGHKLFYTGSKLYMIGGFNWNTRTADGKVYLAEMNPDGSIVGWTEQTDNPLPITAYESMMTDNGEYLIIAGGRGPGWETGQMFDQIYFSKIQPDGTLGSWRLSPIRLPSHLCCAGISTNNGIVYITGGHNGGVYYDDVWSIRFDSLVNNVPQPTNPPSMIANPLVFIPGMGASWNYEAMLHGASVPNSDWEMAWWAEDVYKSIISSLESAGYEKGATLHVYSYDWRKDIRANAASLRDFIERDVLNDSPEGTKVDLAGHSMGGLIARAAVSGDFASKVNKIVTMGSPHMGTAMVYKIWEGADLSSFKGWQALAVQIFLAVNSKKFSTPVEAIHQAVPSLQNLLPLWNFLKDTKGSVKSNADMKWKNNLLSELNSNLPSVLTKMGNIGGKDLATTKYFIIGNRSNRDINMGRWLDGKPLQDQKSDGDDTVLVESSVLNGVWKSDILSNSDHGQLCTSIQGQRKLLEYLGVQQVGYEVLPKDYIRAVVVTVASPAEFSLITPQGNEVDYDQGVAIINNPESGDYQVKLTSTDSGKATLYFGRISNTNVAWDEREVTFTSEGQEETFVFNVEMDVSNLGADPLGDAKSYLKKVKEETAGHPTALIVVEIEKQLKGLDSMTGAELDRMATKILKTADHLIDKISKLTPQKIQSVEWLRLFKTKVDQYASDSIATSY